MADPIEAQVVEERTVASLAPAVIEHSDALVRPAAGEDTIVEVFVAYQHLRNRLLTDSDYQVIAGKRFPKKSAWRKLGVAFGVSFDLKERVYERDDHGRIVRAEVVAVATAPNGRHSDGLGACDLYERCCQQGCAKGGHHKHCPGAKGEKCNASTHFSNAQHDIPSTAETRAKNRAASDLFGFGEVSAEEMNVHRDEGWWGGWTTEEEMKDTTEPVFAWLRGASEEAKARAKAWYSERGLDAKKAITRSDFTEFAAFVAQLRADTAVAAPSPCALCDHDEDKHHPDQTGARICEECAECPGFQPAAA